MTNLIKSRWKLLVGNSIVQNTGWNLAGLVLPLVAALFAVPILIRQIGDAGFGLVSLAWVLIGYFSLFDLGLGRALTHMVATYSHNDRHMLSASASTATMLGLLIGLVGALLIFVGGCWYQPDLGFQEADWIGVLFWISFAIPVVVVSAILRGLLEGLGLFKQLNLIRAPLGALMFIAPALATLIWPSLTVAVAMISLVRLLNLWLFVRPVRLQLRLSRSFFRRELIRPLFEFGGWLTITNLVGPVIVYLDRFLVVGLLGLSLLAYYSAPFELVSRLLMIPGALTAVLFPIFARQYAETVSEAVMLRKRSEKILAVVILPCLILGLALSGWFLGIWLGTDFREKSTYVFQILLLGFSVNCMAQITFTALQALGQTKTTAMIHLVELPIYVLILWMMVDNIGLVGAATAWSLRALADWLAMMYFLKKAESRLLLN